MEHRFYSQLLHPGQDTPLHIRTFLHHGAAHRAAPALQVAHQPPGGVSRSGYKVFHFGIRETELSEDIGPYDFAADRSEHEVHALKRHPVQFSFPILPVVERIGVVVCAIIQGISVPEFRVADDMPFCFRKFSAKHADIVPVVREAFMAVHIEIIVDCHGCRRCRRCRYLQLSVLNVKFISISITGGCRPLRKFHPADEGRDTPGDEISDSDEIVSRCCNCCRQEQDYGRCQQPDEILHYLRLMSKITG